jgi:hypothetical protein
VDPDLPIHLWDRILPQAAMTLNLLRTSMLHPYKSAAAYPYGPVDYNKTPFAPPGCNIIAHEKTHQRRTWAPHGKHGYSLGTAMHHCRSQHVYITSIASERIEDTFHVVPHNSPMPQLSSTYILLMTAQYMNVALKHPHPDFPFSTIGDDTITALAALADIFKNKFQKHLAPTISQQSPVKEFKNKRPPAKFQPVLRSPVKHAYQTRAITKNMQKTTSQRN